MNALLIHDAIQSEQQVMTLLHARWGSDRVSPEYAKDEWIRLQTLLERIFVALREARDHGDFDVVRVPLETSGQ